MIKFNELRVVHSDETNSNYLIIDTEVLKIKKHFDNTYIKRIVVLTQDQYSDNFNPAPNDKYNPVQEGKAIFDTKYFLDAVSGTYVYDNDLQGNLQQYRIELDEIDLPNIDFNKTMFFVYVYTNDVVNNAECVPCMLSKVYDIGVTFSLCPFYNTMLGFLNELYSRCESPRGLIDNFLQYKAIISLVETCNYVKAIEYYKRFLSGFRGISVSHTCNCK